jgi:hypothetical protein
MLSLDGFNAAWLIGMACFGVRLILLGTWSAARVPLGCSDLT